MRRIPPLKALQQPGGTLRAYYPGPWGATQSFAVPGWLSPEEWNSAPRQSIVDTPGGVYVTTGAGEEPLSVNVTFQEDGQQGENLAEFWRAVAGRPFWLSLPHRQGWLQAVQMGTRSHSVRAPVLATSPVTLLVLDYSATQPAPPPGGE